AAGWFTAGGCGGCTCGWPGLATAGRTGALCVGGLGAPGFGGWAPAAGVAGEWPLRGVKAGPGACCGAGSSWRSPGFGAFPGADTRCTVAGALGGCGPAAAGTAAPA